jgi:CheY-like chemotaxis protein
MVGGAIGRMLASEHDVVAVAHAQEALDRLAAGEQFDVIVCDGRMPHMSGMDFHAELSRVAPEMGADRLHDG